MVGWNQNVRERDTHPPLHLFAGVLLVRRSGDVTAALFTSTATGAPPRLPASFRIDAGSSRWQTAGVTAVLSVSRGPSSSITASHFAVSRTTGTTRLNRPLAASPATMCLPNAPLAPVTTARGRDMLRCGWVGWRLETHAERRGRSARWIV